MSEHTPGPWSLDDDKDMHPVGFYGDGAGRGYHAIQIPGQGYLSGFIGDANARLIIAAPDLLDALQKAADTFRDLRLVLTALGTPKGAEACQIAEDASRVIIAKAEGRS